MVQRAQAQPSLVPGGGAQGGAQRGSGEASEALAAVAQALTKLAGKQEGMQPPAPESACLLQSCSESLGVKPASVGVCPPAVALAVHADEPVAPGLQPSKPVVQQKGWLPACTAVMLACLCSVMYSVQLGASGVSYVYGACSACLDSGASIYTC